MQAIVKGNFLTLNCIIFLLPLRITAFCLCPHQLRAYIELLSALFILQKQWVFSHIHPAHQPTVPQCVGEVGKQSCTLAQPLCGCGRVCLGPDTYPYRDGECSEPVLGLESCLGESFPILGLVCTPSFCLMCVHYMAHSQPARVFLVGEHRVLPEAQEGCCRPSPCTGRGRRSAGHGRPML